MTDKPNRTPEQPRSIALSAGSTLLHGATEFAPGTGALLELISNYGERLRQEVQQENERSLNGFFRELSSGTSQLDPSVAQAMFDDRDFHSLVRACIADIEDEKREAYAALAIAVAKGAVAKDWKRHFILSLKELALNELEILRKAYLAKNFNLQPQGRSSGSGVHESDFLRTSGQPGTFQSIAINNLTNRGFVFNEKLSNTGEMFVRACTNETKLSPYAYGYKEWSGEVVPVVCYEIDDKSMLTLATKVEEALWNYQIKSQVIAITRSSTQQPSMLMITRAVLLIGSRSSEINKHMDALADFASKRPVLAAYVTPEAPALPNEVKLAKVLGYEADFDQTLKKLISAILDSRKPLSR